MLYQHVIKELRMHLNFAVDKQTSLDDLLRDNIVILEVFFKTFEEHVSVEEPKNTFIGLISDLSATWSIYAGFSILSIFTIIFAGWFVVAHFLKKTTIFFVWLHRKTRSFNLFLTDSRIGSKRYSD